MTAVPAAYHDGGHIRPAIYKNEEKDFTCNKLYSKSDVIEYIADGAITIRPGIHRITGSGILAMTLALPSAAQAGIHMYFVAGSAHAHTVTTTGFIGVDTGNTMTVGNTVGDIGHVVAVNQKWVVVSAPLGGVA